MSRCEEYRELISRMVDDELTARQKAALEEHIRNCPDCAALYSVFSALSKQIGEDLEDVPLDLRENVMAEVRREDIRRKNRLPRVLNGILAAAACVAVIVGISLGVSPGLRGRISAAAYPKMAAEAAEAKAEEPVMFGAGMERAVFEEAAAPEMFDDAAEAAVEAPQAEEAIVNADLAPMEPAEAEEESGAQRCDLSGWMSIALLRELVGGEPAELTREELGEPGWILRVQDDEGTCEIPFSVLDGRLYYWDPAEDAAFLAKLSPEEFEAFLQS